MKIKLLYAIILFPLLSLAQLTFVPDNNFEAYLEANGMGNGISNDDYVTTSNISDVSNLDVSSLSIADLTGIEDFVSLTNLHCEDNSLTNLNIDTNTQLTTLYCHTNDLNAIDISNNTSLKFFYCNSNHIGELDLGANTALLTLECSFNELTALDLSVQTDIIYLDCGANQITSLDLKANYYLEHVYCYNNALTSLDIRNINNMNISGFSTLNNPDLTCIFVDNVSWSETNWTNIDATSNFVSNQAECDALSINETKINNRISLSPNPATNWFSINTKLEIRKITIYTVLGKSILNFENSQPVYSISNLKRGLYLIQIETQHGITTKKLQIN